MTRYYEYYFDRYGDHFAAARSERDAIAFAIGIRPPDMFGHYDSVMIDETEDLRG